MPEPLLSNGWELRVPQWIDAHGKAIAPLKFANLGSGFKVIYCFQHWCAGCHSHGFPTLKKLVGALSGQGVGFAAVQTVFEGQEVNTFDRLREAQLRYGLEIPFGHDPDTGGGSSLMADFATGGTPWFIVIDPHGTILHSDFRLDAERFIRDVDLHLDK